MPLVRNARFFLPAMSGTLNGDQVNRMTSLKRDDSSSNRHPGSILLFEYDLFGKPVSTFPDHALAPKRGKSVDFTGLGSGTLQIKARPSTEVGPIYAGYAARFPEFLPASRKIFKTVFGSF